MVDADDAAIGRVDKVTDPTALTEKKIKQELKENPNLSGNAVDAFAEKIAEKRVGVQKEARELMRDRITKNGSALQVRKADGTFGPSIPEAGMGDVNMDLTDRGEVSVSIEGDTYDLGSIDLDEGATQEGMGSYSRGENRFSNKRHPAQKKGGGR